MFAPEPTPAPKCKPPAKDDVDAYCLALVSNEIAKVAQEQAQREAERIAAESAELQRQELEAASIQTQQYPAQPPTGGGDAKAFIYEHESGNDPYAVNASSGACGLCQALPCSKMGCALGDYACQDAWCTTYMLGRYGSWEEARAWWLSHNWW